MPIMEAMACGCPVLTSDRFGTKEIAGDAAVLVDPESVDAIAAGIDRLLNDQRAAQPPIVAAGLERSPALHLDADRQRIAARSGKPVASSPIAALRADAGIAMRVLETERLALRRLTLDDAEFIFRLVNEPSWLRFIGDKNVRNLDDARNYLRTGPLDMYERFGFGMFLVERKHDGVAVGACGLLKRDTLPDPDIGYAFLPEYWGKGYALEAASAVLEYGHRRASGCRAFSPSLRPTTSARSRCYKSAACTSNASSRWRSGIR